MAANQAAELTEDKDIIVLPTKTIPQGIVALVIALTIVVAAITWNILRKQRVTA